MIPGHAWIFLGVFLLTASVTSAYACTRCDDFNRERNPSNPCPNNPSQCGACKVGFGIFTVLGDGSCEKILPPVLKNVPLPNVYAVANGAVDLPCQFRSRDLVECVWLRRGFHLVVNNRYQFKDGKNGGNTSDCSIKISNFDNSTDSGEWRCGSLADSNSEGTMSDPITISLKEQMIVRPNDTNVDIGSDVILPCAFDQDIDCVWLRRGFHLEIANRYAFLDNRNGKMAKNCSIHIKNVEETDLGDWQCGSMADSQKEGVLSEKITLKKPLIPLPTIAHQPPRNIKTNKPDYEPGLKTNKPPGKLTKAPDIPEKTFETPSIVARTTTTAPVGQQEAIDSVLVVFVLATVLLCIVVITGAVLLLFWKFPQLLTAIKATLCPNHGTNSNDNERSSEGQRLNKNNDEQQ